MTNSYHLKFRNFVSPLRVHNKIARQLWLDTQGLYVSLTGSLDLLRIIKKLGFVQLVSIQVVSRASPFLMKPQSKLSRADA